MIEEALAGETGLKALCSVLSDVYNTDLSGYENRNVIIANAKFIRSLQPYLKNIRGGVNLGRIRYAIYHHILGTGWTTLDDPKLVTAYITKKERWEEIKKSFVKVTDMRTLCGLVIKDIYDKELADFDNRDTLVASVVFIQSLIETILPSIEKYNGTRSIDGIRSGIYRHVLNRVYNRARKKMSKKYLPLMEYIKDDRRKAEITKALAEAEHLNTVCLGIVKDVYENELATQEDRDAIVVSTPFVESILPMLKNYKYNRKASSIKSGIHLYLLRPLAIHIPKRD